MAEIIQERIEDRLPELEQLERIGLFSHAEIKAIIKKASDLEYKIQRRTLFKEDFINYVQYEINLLELIQRRRTRIGYSFKKDEIENSIVHRVQGVFQRASAKWKDDVQLWLSYVAFCKKWATKTQLSKVFSAMLAIHSNKPALWIMAAKWEMEDRLSSESARQLFLRALRFHPECPKLYKEYFRMELMHAEKLRKEKEEFEKASMDVRLERTMTVFRKAHELKLLSECQYKQLVCLPLWISWAEWSEGAKSQEDTEAVFKKALLAVIGADSVTLKNKYLDWAYRSGGYKKARAVFKSLQESRPFSVDFFRKMIQFEKEQESCNMANIREYYERALREFGSADSDLWMDYMKEELNHPLGRPENCGQIYWRAMKMLQGESAEAFVAKHAMHQTGHL
ncbi:UTP6 isoform 6 [Pan troglodytes]|uniref:UTP6 isoform 6 n=1 Tax=Pan troglodytes TaxID=9598 RepID=A0A2J8LIY4_PANTR|nr:UTP6 isoform 6 [Pan troglodytes]